MSQTIGELFMEQTQVSRLEPSDQSRGLPHPPLELPYTGSGPAIDLPRPADLDLGKVELRQLFSERRTLRKYTDQPLTLDELSFLLWSTQGVDEVLPRPATRRPVPSAGARHAFETLLLVNHVGGVEPGLYRFLAVDHKIARLEAPADINELVTAATDQQNQVRTSAVTFIWVAVLERMRYRYGQRGYRYLHLDAGHVCQNLYLAAEAIDCGVCAIGHYHDETINSLLGLDGVNQFVIYLGSLGKKRK